MTGLRIGERQAVGWRSIDFVHTRVRVRLWDRKAKTFTKPKSRRGERVVRCPTTPPRPTAPIYVTSAVSSSSSPAGATTTPPGSAPSATSGHTDSPAASHSTTPAAMSQICTPRS